VASLPRTLLAAALLVAGCAARSPALEVLNLERGRSWRFPLAAGGAFAVTAHHSMYEAPVTEEYAVAGDGRIALLAVESPSAAVREYLGLTGAGERQEVRRQMPEVVFRVAAGRAQRLAAGGAWRSFLEFGDHGDRLVLRAAAAAPEPRGPDPTARAPE
jgi:hypothetical protein